MANSSNTKRRDRQGDDPDNRSDDPFADLPRPIVAKLEALIRRVRRVTLLKGLFAALATAVGAAMAIMLIDASFTILDDRLRTALSLLALGATLAVAHLHIWRPLRRRIGLAEIARAVEQRHPELEERISTAVELLANDGVRASRGSQQLLAEVVKSASLDARDMRPRREFSSRRAHRPMLATGLACAAIAAAFLAWPGATGKLLTRAFAPFLQTGNAYSETLAISPGDITLPEGGTLTIEVVPGHRDEGRAELRRRVDGGPEAVESMARIEAATNDDPEKFSLTFPAVGEPFEYRVRSGRALSRYFKVEIIPRPTIEEFHIRYEFPAYTRRPPESDIFPGGDIEAVAGTTVSIGAKLDRPVKNATLSVDGAAIWTNQQSMIDNKPLYTWSFPIAAGLDGIWSVRVEDAAGIRNRPEQFAVRAAPDAAPTVRITSPSTPDLTIKPTELLPVGFVATEDFGFSQCQLLIKTPAGDLPPVAVDLPSPLAGAPGSWSGQPLLDLRKLDLGGAASIELRLRVADTLPPGSGGPGVAISDPITILLDHGARSLLEQTLTGQQAEVQRALWDAMEKLVAAGNLAADKPGALLGNERPSSFILLEIQEISLLVGEAESTIRDTAETVATTLFKDLAAPLVALADAHIAPARNAAESIPLTDREVGRVFKARAVIRDLEESIAGLEQILRLLMTEAGRAQMAAELGNLEGRKQQLQDVMGRQSEQGLRDNLQEQIDELDQMAQDLVARSTESLADQFAGAGETAANLSKRAAELAEDQNKLAGLLADADAPERRQQLVVDLIQWLEAEQRDIAHDCSSLREFVKSEPDLDLSLNAASGRADSAADLLTQNLLADSAKAALDNATALSGLRSNTPRVPEELRHLAGWQQSIVRQIASLGSGNLDDALAEMQGELAGQALDLATQAGQFQQDAQNLADAQSAQQAMQAAEQIADAARAAASANSQLGGQSGGSFQFARNPEAFATSENSPPGPPPPTQAGSGRPSDTILFGEDVSSPHFAPPPDVTTLDGTAGTPFQIGEVALEQIPPALTNDRRPQGGALPPGYATTTGQTDQITNNSDDGQTAGRASGARGASESGASAGAGLGAAAGSLAAAADSLSSQASTPIAQQQPDQLTPESAQERMRELAAQVARQQAPSPDAPSQQTWARIGGQTKSGIATGSRSKAPAGYRDLIKLYFEEIARRPNNATHIARP